MQDLREVRRVRQVCCHLTAAGMDPMPLRGKVAIVTGSSMGIGKAIAEALSNAGANVVVAPERDLPYA